MTTIAKMEYRNYVPYGWIAIEYCNLEFIGYNANELTDKWCEIKYDK